MEIRQILDKIDENQIFVPAFQREYVWKRNNVKALFASLIRRYPTGTLLTWETSHPPELKGPVQFKSEMGSVKLILDGQQRVTTLYMLMRGKIPPYYTQKDITHDVTNLYMNIRTLDLEYYKPSVMKNDPAWVGLTQIFQNKINQLQIVQELSEDQDEQRQFFENIKAVENISDRAFPEQMIPPDANIRKAIDIFYIVNAGGVNLTEAELALAQISGYWPKARKLFKVKLAELKEQGFNFKLDFIVFCLLATLHHKGSDMPRLHSKDNDQAIREAWSRLDDGILDYVINILKTNAYIDHSDEINSVFALVPIIAYVFKKPDGKLTEDEITRVVRWFYYSQIWQRYISQTPQKLDRDLGVVRDNDDPFSAMLDQIQLERRSLAITKDDFVGRDVRHPLFSLMRWYFKSQGAVCLGTGVGLRQNMGEKYKLEKDHIFPYSALKENGYRVENRLKYPLAQEITNRAILTQIENRSKSATAAFDYLSSVAENFPNALEKQCIPNDPDLWSMDRFEDFLETRRIMLAEHLNSFLEGLGSADSHEAEISVADMIATGEHDELEFKQTLRWDINESRPNKALEDAVLRTISAFANAEGGALIIGVDDDYNSVGLEDDYATLREGSRDEFELHLRNLIRAEWGAEFDKNNISVKFPIVDDVEICLVDIKRSNEAIYYEMMNKHGQKHRKLFVRSGNSSPPMEDEIELAKYLAKRFPHMVRTD